MDSIDLSISDAYVADYINDISYQLREDQKTLVWGKQHYRILIPGDFLEYFK